MIDKESKMKFDELRVYTALNGDKLKKGDRVIIADTMSYLRRKVADGSDIGVLKEIRDDNCTARFGVEGGCFDLLAYLVERKENCTNCVRICSVPKMDKTARCWAYEPKTEQKAEPTYKWVNYRPFRDINELINVWKEKSKQVHSDYSLTMPYIWVRKKLNFSGLIGELITRLEDSYVDVNGRTIPLHVLFTEYEFLDGSPCGVEE